MLMKKIIVVASLITSLTSLSAFGQGYGLFTGNPRTVWDSFTYPDQPHVTSNVNVAFLWGMNGSAPLVESILNGVPTNATSMTSPFSIDAAWTDIVTDPNFTLAHNASDNSLVSTRTLANGGFSYNSSSTFGISGTTAGTTYTLFVIGWDATYATPQLAAAAGSAVGWSPAFSYSVTSEIGTPLTMPASGLAHFGVVPEPTTMALAGLGSLSLLLFRRGRR